MLFSSALAAPSGNYKGKIEYQGYEMTFKVSKKGKRVTDLVARMLVDCDGDGYTENFLTAPQGSWPINNGKGVRQAHRPCRSEQCDRRAQGPLHGRQLQGLVREVDFVEGSGIVCHTLKRKFTAKRR